MITLRADGTGEMAAGLMVGTNVAGSVAYIRSVNALEWNNGRGFLFKYRKDSDSTEALIGRTTPYAALSPVERRLAPPAVGRRHDRRKRDHDAAEQRHRGRRPVA